MDAQVVQTVLDVLTDSVIDTLYLVPFLFVTYLFMEWLEHRASENFQAAIRRAGVAGPLAGAVLGVIPQCGFSGVASTLYAARVVSLGTLFAVFLSTSDEMLPIFIAQQVPAEVVVAVLVGKIAIGIVVGVVVDAVARATHRNHVNYHIHDLCEYDGCACECDTCDTCERAAGAGGCAGAGDAEHGHDCEHDCVHDHGHGCEHEHSHDHGHDHAGEACVHGHRHSIVRSALKHTVRVTLFVFVIVLVLNALLAVVGEATLATFIGSNSVLAVFASALVGLIPNCAASVTIAQMYVDGLLGAGPMMAGLLSAAGVGLLVLFRTNHKPKDNIAIVVGLWAISAVVGLIIVVLGIA